MNSADTPPRGGIGQVVDAYRVNSSAIAVGLLIITNLIPCRRSVAGLGPAPDPRPVLGRERRGRRDQHPQDLDGRGHQLQSSTMRWSVNGRPATSLSRLGTAGFFTVHYGLFWVVHGVFVFTFIPAMTGLAVPGLAPAASPPDQFMPRMQGVDLPVFAFGVVGLAISHGVSFWMNYLGRGEYLTLSPADVMTQPYGRLVIMHLTILLGAFVSIFFGTPRGPARPGGAEDGARPGFPPAAAPDRRGRRATDAGWWPGNRGGLGRLGARALRDAGRLGGDRSAIGRRVVGRSARSGDARTAGRVDEAAHDEACRSRTRSRWQWPQPIVTSTLSGPVSDAPSATAALAATVQTAATFRGLPSPTANAVTMPTSATSSPWYWNPGVTQPAAASAAMPAVHATRFA